MFPFKKKNKQIDIWNMAFPDTKKDKASLGDELSSGLQYDIFRGLSSIMPNPDPVLKKLGWNKDIEAYKEILADPQLYGAIENNRKPGVSSQQIYIKNPNGDQAEIDFLQKWFEKLQNSGEYQTKVNQSLDTPQFGRMVFGTVWQIVDNKFLPVRIEAMPHELCKFDYDGNLMISDDGVTFNKPINPAKYLLLRHKNSLANPYGEPILSRCYWNVRFKKDGFKLWAEYADRFGMPTIHGSYNTAAIEKAFNLPAEAAATQLFEKLQNMARGGVIVTPDGTTITMVPGGNVSSSDIFERLVRICDEQNTKLQLGHSGATESTTGALLTAENTALRVRQEITDSDKQYPTNLFNQIISWIHYFNFTGPEIPRFDLYASSAVDQETADRDAKLVPVFTLSGIRWTEDYFKNTYGFEDGDIEPLPAGTLPVIPSGNPKAPALPAPKPSNPALPAPATPALPAKTGNEALIEFLMMSKAQSKEYPDQLAIDEFADYVFNRPEENNKMMNKLLKPIIEFVNSGKSLEQMLADYHKLLPKMKSNDVYNLVLKLKNVADIHGYNSAHNEEES